LVNREAHAGEVLPLGASPPERLGMAATDFEVSELFYIFCSRKTLGSIPEWGFADHTWVRFPINTLLQELTMYMYVRNNNRFIQKAQYTGNSGFWSN
jgi:hypothetical protein